MAVQSNSNPSLAQRWENYQPTKSIVVWACALTAVVTMVIGFGWGGWVTGGASKTLASTAGDIARGELASTICVEKFKAAPDATAKLAELNAITDAYKRRQFVETGGWAMMPGQTSADRRASEGCAAALAA